MYELSEKNLLFILKNFKLDVERGVCSITFHYGTKTIKHWFYGIDTDIITFKTEKEFEYIQEKYELL